MASVTVEVKGLRELGERMRLLSTDMALKIARQATGAAAQVIKKEAKLNIQRSPSIDTRSLLDAVIVKRLGKKDSTLTSEHIVTVRRRKVEKTGSKQMSAPHARFIEFGTVKMPAEPFLRPAIESRKGEALNAMVDKLKKGIDKAGRR